MINLLKFLACILFLASCNVQRKGDYFDVKFTIIEAEIYQLEDKGSFYIYHIRNNKLNGIFTGSKICESPLSWENIKLNKKYKLVLQKLDLHASSHFKVVERIHVDNFVVWDSESNISYFPSCSNICGDKIYRMK